MKPDLAKTIVKYCKNLKHLELHNPGYSMNNTALKKLTELENLECLVLGVAELHKESIIAISNNCKKLKRLEIPGCAIVPSIDGNLFSSSSVLDELSKLQCLEHLNLSQAKSFKDSTITAIANNCKNLKTLELQNCRAITKTALVALTNLENLQKLDVRFLDIITNSFIIKLKGLKELHCDNCEKLTDAGVIQFIKNNPDLEKISIRHINNITIDLVIAANEATKNRTNGIILHLETSYMLKTKAFKSIIESQWLVVKYL
ncbi:F-box/LRR-repeat protein 4-like [Aphidius gifuensis]|uniref:F-box/LRR-repeat protein 4-like n=1 Tax=Aphidius gifuensis TaxID=684658 RepID=UPI001CDB93BA|nr:F-box/LRR-repeat protein 4-like [Aphidius gifuensis]